MQLIAKIIADAESTEIEIKMGEQNAQKEYASFVSATTASIEADRQAIESAEEQPFSKTMSYFIYIYIYVYNICLRSYLVIFTN